jgi:hypothetical protein
MQQPHYVTETQIVKKLAKDRRCKFIWTIHSLEEMTARFPAPATAADVEHCLMSGQVILEEYKRDILWRVKGRDLDGRVMEVVIAVFEEEKRIKVITVI